MKFDYFGLIANYFSLAFVALSGILSNIIIIKVYTAADLGVYNLSYAFFVIISQLSCFGVHLSCLRYLSVEHEKNRPLIIFSAVLFVFFISLFVSLIFYFLIFQFIQVFGDSDLSVSLKIIAVALVFYALNKVLMFSANGMRKMTLFASMQAARAAFLLIYICSVAFIEALEYPLAGAFLFSEITLLIILASNLLSFFKQTGPICQLWFWIKRHFVFGRSVFASGLSTEVNTRVDILVLGLFLNDAAVGVYSFISMLVEGFYQLLVVVKNNINPILAKLIHEDKISELKQFTNKVFLASFVGIFIFSIILFFLYPVAIEFFGVAQKLEGSIMILGVLLGFMVLVSGWFPFDQILSQAGNPLASSYMYIAVMLFNLAGNLVLVPIMGILGAAVATGTSWIVLAIILNFKVLKIVNINLFPFNRT